MASKELSDLDDYPVTSTFSPTHHYDQSRTSHVIVSQSNHILQAQSVQMSLKIQSFDKVYASSC